MKVVTLKVSYFAGNNYSLILPAGSPERCVQPIISLKNLYFILLLLIFSCFNKTTPEMYLIPKGYQGKILVVFDQPNGEKEKFEGEKRVYLIDKNGILLTRFIHEHGVLNQEYYYVNSDGSKERIEIDSSIFWTDPVRIKQYNLRNEDKVLVRNFGVAGSFNDFTFAESVIGTRHFVDTTNLEKLDERQWKIVLGESK